MSSGDYLKCDECERLKQENDVRNVRITELFLTNEELFIENKQLKEALRKRGAYLWNENLQSYFCAFCENDSSYEHKSNCLYINLTK